MPGDATRSFEQARPRLLGLAYRILGSRADAEDAVQDCYVKWLAADHDAIDSPLSWLTTVCTRRCLDLLRAAHRTRTDYFGTWLPEPLHMAADPDGIDAELAASLGTAFLLMLERLSPKERAAYLLHEIFDQSYADVAATLDMQEAACRKLVQRAKAHVEAAEARHAPSRDMQDRLIDAFHDAVLSGSTAQLAELLREDVRLTADGGGKVKSILGVLEGDRVLHFVRFAHKWWKGFTWRFVDMNGGRGAILTDGDTPMLTLSFAYDADGRVADIFVMRNPDKLTRLEAAEIL